MLRHITSRQHATCAIASLIISSLSFLNPWFGWMDTQPTEKWPVLVALPAGYITGTLTYIAVLNEDTLGSFGLISMGALGAVSGFQVSWLFAAIVYYNYDVAGLSAFHAGTMWGALYLVSSTACKLYQPRHKGFKKPLR